MPCHDTRRRDADSKRARFAKGNPLCASLRLFDVLQNASRIIQKYVPRLAQSDSSRQSVEQEEAHLPFQVLNLPRQGRLCDMEARGRSSEVLLLSDGDEIA